MGGGFLHALAERCGRGIVLKAGHWTFLSLKGTSWSANTNSLPRTSNYHTDITARALPRSGFVHEGAKPTW